MIPELSDADIALVRLYWPNLPDELVTQEAVDTAAWAARIEQGRRDNAGPLTLADIQKGVQMQKPRPPRVDRDDDSVTALAIAIIAAVALLGCCCGAGIVGALWGVFG